MSKAKKMQCQYDEAAKQIAEGGSGALNNHVTICPMGPKFYTMPHEEEFHGFDVFIALCGLGFGSAILFMGFMDGVPEVGLSICSQVFIILLFVLRVTEILRQSLYSR